MYSGELFLTKTLATLTLGVPKGLTFVYTKSVHKQPVVCGFLNLDFFR